MKKKFLISLTIVFVFAVCSFGVYYKKIVESGGKDYYVLEDFKDIEIGKSTFLDVNRIAPSTSMIGASYGGKCEYPMQNGKCIVIKFYGEDLVVGEIEIK